MKSFKYILSLLSVIFTLTTQAQQVDSVITESERKVETDTLVPEPIPAQNEVIQAVTAMPIETYASVEPVIIDSMYYPNVELKTYNYLLEKKWNDLITFGNEALKAGLDYEYLRMRLGMAYYEKKNYNLAEYHFRKAYAFDSTNVLTHEYLYYSYLFLGRGDEARWISTRFSKETKSKFGKLYGVAMIFMEGGTKSSDSALYYDSKTKTHSSYFNNPTYFQFGFKHYVEDKVTFTHAITYFKQKTYLGTVEQKQYFVNLSIPFGHGWNIAPVMHFMNFHFESVPYKVTRPNPFPPFNQIVSEQVSTTNSTYFVGSIGLSKSYKKWTFNVFNTYSNLYDSAQFIHSLGVNYNVFGNTKLVLGASVIGHAYNSYSDFNTGISTFMYYQPIKALSFKLSYYQNKGHNIVEDNGYLINNSSDLTSSRFGAMINYTFAKRFTVYALYQLESKLENAKNFNYKYNVMVGGLKINL